jgi:hypothetical protein
MGRRLRLGAFPALMTCLKTKYIEGYGIHPAHQITKQVSALATAGVQAPGSLPSGASQVRFMLQTAPCLNRSVVAGFQANSVYSPKCDP